MGVRPALTGPVYGDEKGEYTEACKVPMCFMNARQLAKLGVPEDCVPQALQVVQTIAKHNRSVPKDHRIDVEQAIRNCVEQPDPQRESSVPVEAVEQAESPAAHVVALGQLKPSAT